LIKDLINPANFNLMVSKVSDVLVGALAEPLVMQLIGEESGLSGQFILRLHVVA
jgi:hypothetical protein